MDVKKRTHAVAEFKEPSRRPKVLIISLKAGGVGLNVNFPQNMYCDSTDGRLQLTTANHVFMVCSMDERRYGLVNSLESQDGLLVERSD